LYHCGLVINNNPLHSINCPYSSLKHYHSLPSPSPFSFLIQNLYMENFSTKMFGITEFQDFTNSYIATLFANGKMKICDDGARLICDNHQLFCIPNNYTYNVLIQKVCAPIPCPSNTSINNLYFKRPTMTSERCTIYEAFELKPVKMFFKCCNVSVFSH